MLATGLVSWAVPRLSQLLPLDEESLTQIVTYSTTLSKEACAEHLKNLLGDSPTALEFISSFNSRRGTKPDSAGIRTQSHADETDSGSAQERPSSRSRKTKKSNVKAPLHVTGSPRIPENYGNTTGGYMKRDTEEDYMPAAKSSRGANKPDLAPNGNITQGPFRERAALQESSSMFLSPYKSSAGSSRNQSPTPKPHCATSTPSSTATKFPPSASGPLMSDFLPNVKSKAAKSQQGVAGTAGAPSSSGTSSPSKRSSSPAVSLITNNIADLTAAIAALELTTNPKLAGQATRQKCNCYATIHPLFTPAPNCLHCGKIICSLEGIQPCSFCGSPLLSSEDVQSMIHELRQERGQEKMRAHNESVHHHHDSGPVSASASSSDSASKLDAARAHRDKLLSFQTHNAQRTRVVDEAADFEPPTSASTMWMTPAQRALALKKQQRVQRQLDEQARPEWEKKTTMMSLDIKGGRVTRVYHTAAAVEQPAEKDAQAEENEKDEPAAGEDQDRGRALSRNPLLAAGGLLRPVWNAGAADGKPPERTDRKQQTWRRVQHDNDDNEQWILDGGLHGYTT